jgi:hypothetical protein
MDEEIPSLVPGGAEVSRASAEITAETWVIRKEKEPKRKVNRPDGKVENAMKLRFPLSHRACHQRRREKGGRRRNHLGN